MTIAVKPSINEQKEIIGLRKLIKSTWNISVSDAQVEKFVTQALKKVQIHLPRLIVASPQYGLSAIVEQKKQSVKFNDGETVVLNFYSHLSNYLSRVFAVGQEHLKESKKEFYALFEDDVKAWGNLKVMSGSALATDLKHNGKDELPIVKAWNKSTLKSLEQFNQYDELRETFLSELFLHLAGVVSYEQEKRIHQEVEDFDKKVQASVDHFKNAHALDKEMVKAWNEPVLKSFLDYLNIVGSNIFQSAQEIEKAKLAKQVKEKAGITAEDTSDFMSAMAGVKPLNKGSGVKSKVEVKKPEMQWDQLSKKYLNGEYDVA